MADNQDAVPEVPLALVSNQYYESKIAQMRNRPVPWEVMPHPPCHNPTCRYRPFLLIAYHVNRVISAPT